MDAPRFKSRRVPPRLVVCIFTYCFEEDRARASKAAGMATTTLLLAAAALLVLPHPCAAAYFPVSTKSPVAAPPQFIVFTCAFLRYTYGLPAMLFATLVVMLHCTLHIHLAAESRRAVPRPPDGRRSQMPLMAAVWSCLCCCSATRLHRGTGTMAILLSGKGYMQTYALSA